MPDRVLHEAARRGEAAEPTMIEKGLSDERFAFEVIRNLGDSIRALNADFQAVDSKLDEVLERVLSIEAHSMVERLARLETKIEAMEREQLKAKGLKEAASWFFQSPMIMWLAGLAVAIYVWITNHTPGR